MKNLIYLLLLVMNISVSHASTIKVLYTKGKNLKIEKSGSKKVLTKGMTLAESDKIKTGNDGFVIINLNGHSTTRIEEDSEVTLSKLPIFDKESNELESGASFFLSIGTLLVDVEKEYDTEALNVKTANTTFGVRGTKFLVSKDTDTLVAVNSGTVEIKNSLSKQNDFVTKDESVVIEKGKSFTARQKYDFQKNIDWNARAKKRRTRFKNLRAKYKSEFRKKRSRWKKDPKRLIKLQQRWNKRKAQFKKRINAIKAKRKKIRANRSKTSSGNLQKLRERKKKMKDRPARRGRRGNGGRNKD